MADTLQAIQLGYGKVNLSSATSTFAPLRLSVPFIRDSAVTTGRRVPNTQTVTPVSAHPKINGIMTTDSVMHPNGTIIMLQASKSRGGRAIADGCILLRLREEAANLNIIGKLPLGHDNLIGDRYSIFRGRADILSPDEVEVFRIKIPTGFVNNYFTMEEINDLFDIHELAPAIVERPEVALVSTAQGLVTKELAPIPTRRMRLRKS